jgi:hypothetical protein
MPARRLGQKSSKIGHDLVPVKDEGIRGRRGGNGIAKVRNETIVRCSPRLADAAFDFRGVEAGGAAVVLRTDDGSVFHWPASIVLVASHANRKTIFELPNTSRKRY